MPSDRTPMKRTSHAFLRVTLAVATVSLVVAAFTVAAIAQSQNTQTLPAQNEPSQTLPRLPSGQGSEQTLTLPQVAPQPMSPPPAALPGSQGGEGETEVPIAPQPQSSIARISITATDQSGHWISDLRKQDVAIYEDGVQRPVLGLQRDFDTPISIGIVVDTSGSMSWKLAATRAALEHFIGALNRGDQVFLMAFSNRTYLLQTFTSNVSDLDRAISILHAGGQTALFDAVVQGLGLVEQGRWPKKALLVLTDGMDNVSSNTLDSTIQAARRAGVLIYTVGLGTVGGSGPTMMGPMMMGPMMGGFGMGFGGGHRRFMGGGGEDERVDASTLATLSDETGATTFIMNPRVSDMSGLDAHFQRISMELREQYTLRYSSAGGSAPHQVRVEGLRDGIRVRAPKWAAVGAGGYSAFPG
jgi:VWFA-related protein